MSAALLLALALQASARAEAPGANSFNFLKLSGSGRQTGMGGAGAAVPEETGAADLNPAALCGLRGQAVQFSYNQLFEGIQYGHLRYAQPTQALGNLSAALQYMDYGDIRGFDAFGTGQGAVRASDRLLALGWSSRGLSLAPGATIKVAQEQLDSVTATALALDMGLLYSPGAETAPSPAARRLLSRMTFGAAVRNLGPGVRFEDRKEKLPLALGAGLAYRGFADALTIALDVERQTGRPEAVVLHAGAEAWIKGALALRAGFRTDQEAGPGVSAGLGFQLGDVRLDYAFTPFGDLGNAHRAGLTLRFGRGVADIYYEEGVRQMQLGNYADAVILLDKALAIVPDDRRVLSKALEASRAMRAAQGKGEPPSGTSRPR